MKKSISIIILMICCSLVFAQDDGSSSGENKDVNLFSFPVSPEAGRLGSYGKVPVNLSTGQINFPVSLYTINARGYSWPINLSYNFKGLVYEDKPSIVGLGWNLTAGGVVTREVRGIPDEHPKGYYGETGESQRLLNTYFNGETLPWSTPELFVKGDVDTEADKYNVSVNGVSFGFVIGLNKQPVYTSEHNHKVELKWKNSYELDGFEVTDHNGIRYIFEDKEYNSPIGGNSNIFNDRFTEYTSSWNLTKVIFPNTEELSFRYQDYNYYSIDFYASGTTNSIQVQCGGPNFTPKDTYNDGFSKTLIKRKVLSQIIGSTARVSFGVPLVLGATNDGYRVTYNTITVREAITNTLLWKYDFSYESNRDVLTEIKRNNEHYYSFEYKNKQGIPPFINQEGANAFRQDLWGFYNGQNNQYGVNVAGTSYEADLSTNFSYASTGALTKIIYPTKGFTTISYEQNTVKSTYQDMINSTTQTYTPNYQIELELNSDRRSGYKEETYRYTFRDTTVATISYRLEAQSASFSGVSLTKIDPCNGNSSTTSSLGNYADYLRATTKKSIPNMCPLFNVVIDDGDIDQDYNSIIKKEGSTRGQIKIEPGTYDFKIWTNSNHEYVYGRIKLRFYMPPHIMNDESEEGTPQFANRQVGGIRIARLTNYTSALKIADTKYFEYVDEDGFSSGKQMQVAMIGYQNTVEHCCNTGGGTEDFVVNHFARVNYTHKSYNPVNLNQGVPVIYTTVRQFAEKRQEEGVQGTSDCNTEECLNTDVTTSNGVLTYLGGGIMVNDTNTNQNVHYTNGYTEYKYDYDRIGLPDYPIVPKGSDLAMGRVKETNTYRFDTKTLGYPKIAQEQTDFVMIKDQLNANGLAYNTNYPKSIKIARRIIKDGGNCTLLPASFNLDEYYKIIPYTELDKNHLPNKIVNKQYFQQLVSTTQTLSYDSHYQVKKSTTIDSKGQTIITEKFYPYDAGMVTGGLLSANIYTPVLGSVTTKNGNVVSKSRTDYGVPKDNSSTIIKPIKQWAAIGDQPLRGVAKYDRYDSYGNLLQYYKVITDGSGPDVFGVPLPDEAGTMTAAIYGYNHSYPVAQIVNGSYDEAVALLSVSIAELQQLDGAALQQELDLIRQGLPQAQVTTYTYKPQIGVSSIADPRGYTTYYEYDELHRLKLVKDEDGNLISENKYNYKQ